MKIVYFEKDDTRKEERHIHGILLDDFMITFLIDDKETKTIFREDIKKEVMIFDED